MKKKKKTWIIIVYIIFGVLPTIFMFATHDLFCRYEMNPLCYIKCVFYAIIASPILLFVNYDEDENDDSDSVENDCDNTNDN